MDKVWFDYLGEQMIKHGITIRHSRQKRGYTLSWRRDIEKFEVRQGMSAHNGDIAYFKLLEDAYDWLINGHPIKREAKEVK